MSEKMGEIVNGLIFDVFFAVWELPNQNEFLFVLNRLKLDNLLELLLPVRLWASKIW